MANSAELMIKCATARARSRISVVVGVVYGKSTIFAAVNCPAVGATEQFSALDCPETIRLKVVGLRTVTMAVKFVPTRVPLL